MSQGITGYNKSQDKSLKIVCDLLFDTIQVNLPKAESKIWHGHPVWFLDGNPTVGYSVQKAGVRLMFWSGADFDEPNLQPGTGKFKDASIIYTDKSQISVADLKRWLEKSKNIQWDYKNIVKNHGKLERIR